MMKKLTEGLLWLLILLCVPLCVQASGGKQKEKAKAKKLYELYGAVYDSFTRMPLGGTTARR